MTSNNSSSNMNYFTNIFSENKVFAIIKVRNKKKWTKEEDSKLIRLAEKNREKHWKEISKNFLNKNPLQCFSRYKRIKPGIIKGTWTKEEDEHILNLVGICGKSWSKLAKIMKSRNGKQIRDRFINVLDPDVKKGKFTYKEDKKIKELYKRYGPRWATIARNLPNRTPDMIKNRFHSSIKKYLHQKTSVYKNQNKSKTPKDKENYLMKMDLQNNLNSGEYLLHSNSKSFSEKKIGIDISNCSSSIQEINNQTYLFKNSCNRMFYNDIKNTFSSSFFNKETNIFINENENICNPFDKIFSIENFRNNLKSEFNNIENKINNISPIANAEVIIDSERTVSISDYSSRAKEKKIQFSKFKDFEHSRNHSNENFFEFPVEQTHLGFLMFSNPKFEIADKKILIDSNLNKEYCLKNQKNFEINSLKDNTLLTEIKFRDDSDKIFSNCSNLINNQNKNEKYDKFNEEIIHILSENYNVLGHAINDHYNCNINKLTYDKIIKNEQLIEKLKSYSSLEKDFYTQEKIATNAGLIETNLYQNSEFEFNHNKNNFLNSSENSKSTNLVSCQNHSTCSNNFFTLDENEHSSHDNIINTNGNSYNISLMEDNNQMNFINFADSPFRMNSPKYYDFEDFFNNN